MKKIFKRVHIYCLALVLVACSDSGDDAGPSAAKKDKEGKKTPQAQVHSEEATCLMSSVERILNDGRTIVSRMNSNEGLILWDVLTKKVKKQVNYAFNYLDISSQGQYVLRQISERRYMIRDLLSNGAGHVESFVFPIGKKTQLGFNSIGNYLVSFHKEASKMYNLALFDIEKKDIVYSDHFTYIEDVKVNENNEIAVIDTQENELIFVSKNHSRKIHIRIPEGRLQESYMTSDNFLLRIDRDLFIFDLDTHELVRRLNIDYVIDVDEKNNSALIKRGDDTDIINLRDGLVERKIKLSNDMIQSSCQLNGDLQKVFCKSSLESHKIKALNIDSGQVSNLCLVK